jgi:catechol 2,3-dioxygenase-like lactoylglutathione lyase family enzyme
MTERGEGGFWDPAPALTRIRTEMPARQSRTGHIEAPSVGAGRAAAHALDGEVILRDRGLVPLKVPSPDNRASMVGPAGPVKRVGHEHRVSCQVMNQLLAASTKCRPSFASVVDPERARSSTVQTRIATPLETDAMLKNARIFPYIPVRNLTRARKFYEGTLGIPPAEEFGGGVIYKCGNGSSFFMYVSQGAGTSSASQAFWEVDDVDAEVAELKARGVAFEEYDLPGLKTVNSIATGGGAKTAWFKDSEGNILAVSQTI